MRRGLTGEEGINRVRRGRVCSSPPLFTSSMSFSLKALGLGRSLRAHITRLDDGSAEERGGGGGKTVHIADRKDASFIRHKLLVHYI